MEYITRKTLLYKSGVAPMDYTINHVLGCSHGCRFPCYAFLMAKRFGRVQSYSEWLNPKLVSNAMELLTAELPRLRLKIHRVHLCFSTDPFMYGYPEIAEMSLSIIKKLNAEGIPCSILTKGILPQQLAELSPDNHYGITLVSLDEAFRLRYEPGTAPYEQRRESLHRLHMQGCSTFVSMEPYPTPNIHTQSVEPILEAIGFVDSLHFGRTNYNRIAASYPGVDEYYHDVGQQVAVFCTHHGIRCDVMSASHDNRDHPKPEQPQATHQLNLFDL